MFQTLYDFVVENDVPQPQKMSYFCTSENRIFDWHKNFHHIEKNKIPKNKLNQGGGRSRL